MIYTSGGNTVRRVESFHHDTGVVVATVVDRDGTEYELKDHVTYFRADGGIREIIDAAKSHRGQSAPNAMA